MVTRPVLLAVLAVLPRQFLRLFVDPIEYRQAVSEPPQNEYEVKNDYRALLKTSEISVDCYRC